MHVTYIFNTFQISIKISNTGQIKIKKGPEAQKKTTALVTETQSAMTQPSHSYEIFGTSVLSAGCLPK